MFLPAVAKKLTIFRSRVVPGWELSNPEEIPKSRKFLLIERFSEMVMAHGFASMLLIEGDCDGMPAINRSCNPASPIRGR